MLYFCNGTSAECRAQFEREREVAHLRSHCGIFEWSIDALTVGSYLLLGGADEELCA